MITEFSKLLNRASISLKSSDVLLQKGSWVKFSSYWPADANFGWASGQSFQVAADPVLLRFPTSVILQNNDYAYLDLSNQVPPGTVGAPASLQMYPAKTGVLYQIFIGMKPGKYFVQLQIPKNLYVYAPGSTSIFPDITNASYKYIGAKYPGDSPDTGPLWCLYAIYNQPAFILVPYVDGIGPGDAEKCTFDMYINKCPLQSAQLSPDQARMATYIEYYTELQGF